MSRPKAPPAPTVAEKLRELIGPERGASTRLAERLGMDPGLLRFYTSGRSVPGAEKLLLISRALGVSLAEFDGCAVGE